MQHDTGSIDAHLSATQPEHDSGPDALLLDAVPDHIFQAPNLDAFDFWDPAFSFATNWFEAPAETNFVWGSPDTSTYLHLDSGTRATCTNLPSEGQALVLEASSVNPTTENVASTLPRSDEQSPDGEFYVDGESARLPRTRRNVESAAQERPPAPYDFTKLSLYTDARYSDPTLSAAGIDAQAYARIQTMYELLCIAPSAPSDPFVEVQLPSKELFEHMCFLYHSNFNQIMPFIHEHGSGYARHPILDLAVAAVGSQYTSNILFAASMHEFVRRWLSLLLDDSSLSADVQTDILGALLLNVVGLAYCGNSKLHKYACRARHELAARFPWLLGKIKGRLGGKSVACGTGGSAIGWRLWLRQETLIRMSHAIWMLDAMMNSHFEEGPLLSSRHLDLPLPCTDELWRAEDEERWTRLQESQQERQTLVDVLQELYIHRSYSVLSSEFVRVLTIHGLHHRVWEVERYYSSPLAQWEPTTNKSTATTQLPRSTVWLPSLPVYRKWQNVTCDALDVLHWQANATIGKARGMEHPTVLHLHVARLVLLVPTNEIIRLARQRAGTSHNGQHDETVATIRLIKRWAVQHQYKARLAMIHAGVVFWHVRRYRIDAFYEPFAVGLATLSLWAFSLFAKRGDDGRTSDRATPSMPASNQNFTSRRLNPQNDELDIEALDTTGGIILLDRPTDDELVQHFIRNGENMKPHMSSVGAVYSEDAPRCILLQGSKLLSTLTCWAVSASWSSLIQQLAEGRQTSEVANPLQQADIY